MSYKPTIKTPETDPDHETIGRDFRGHDGFVYHCDSWQSDLGFWMTRKDAPEDRKQDKHSEFRRNVSINAIGKTFHRID